MDLFSLKKMIGSIVTPLNISLLLMLFSIAIFFLWPKVAFFTIVSSFCVLLIFSMPISANKLMWSVEKTHPVYSPDDRDVDFIIVLGSYYSGNKSIPPTGQLSTYGLQRLVEAVRLLNIYPNAKLITSGSGFGSAESYASVAARAAIAIGIAPDRIIQESRPKGTEEEAFYISPIVKNGHSLLVTHANHMPRAIKFFEKYEIEISPVPTAFWVKSSNFSLRRANLTPSTHKLNQSSFYLYEVIGALWQKIKD
jgi:uncharacterized SAM-binding protein YcdF (DUF218 family)